MKKKLKRTTTPSKTIDLKPATPVVEMGVGPDLTHPRLVGKLLGRTFNHVKLTDGSYVMVIAPN